MTKNTWIGLVVILVIIVVGSLYFLGIGYNTSSVIQLATTTQATSTKSVATTQGTNSKGIYPASAPSTEAPAPPVHQVIQPLSTMPSSVTSASSNSDSSCKTFADNIANQDTIEGNRNGTVPGSVTVVDSHYSQTLGQCYYELSEVATAGLTYQIHMAPNDTLIAGCVRYNSGGATVCTESSGQAVTQSGFNTLLNQYMID